jgi:hypothetical protein
MKKILVLGVAFGMLSLFAVAMMAHDRPAAEQHDGKVEFNKSDVVNHVVMPYSISHLDYAADLPVVITAMNSSVVRAITYCDATVLVTTCNDVEPNCNSPGINV